MAFPLPMQVETYTGLILWVNEVTGGIAGKVFLLSFWIICSTWLLTSGKDVQALMVSTGATLIMAMFLQIGGFIEFPIVIIILVAFAVFAIAPKVIG